jgi:ATP-dependent Lhr-like helicase
VRAPAGSHRGARANDELACTIVDSGHRREIDLGLELPGGELEAVASTEQVAEVLDKIAGMIMQRKITLVFVNTRRLSERLAHQLAERLGAQQVAAHHGSLSKERRLQVEARLRAGELRAVVATASLELGIDVGPVELVCQIGSPRSIATLLQRVGRSGHSRFATPVGRLFPLTRDELVECAALLRAVRDGKLDAISLPEPALDVLAQQVVAECAAEEWDETALFELVRQAAPYAQLARTDFDRVVELMAEGIVTGRGRRAAYLHRDRVAGRIKGRRGARITALTSGGAIPDNADYRVVADPDDVLVGTINEDFAIESMVGDVFLLGSTSWRIRRVERGVVRVVDAQGATPTVPFWLGEAPARTAELSHEVSELRAVVGAHLDHADSAAALGFLRADVGLSEVAAAELLNYLSASHASLGRLPTQHDLVFERFFDETGGMQLVLHAPLGGRINRALGLLLRKRFCTSFDFELQAAASDDAVVLSLGPQHSFPLEQTPAFLRPVRVREALVQAVLATPMFAVRWRWNLNRALIVLRFRDGKKNPPALQRMESDDVMVSVFPALAACQDNATGPREIPDHLLVQQTLSDCLCEAMDLNALELLLEEIAAGSVRIHFCDTTEPSPLAHEILNSRPYTFLDDAPLEERRTRAVQLRRGLPVHARELCALDPAAIERVRAEARPEPRDADELHDWLLSLLVCRPEAAWGDWFSQLSDSGRTMRVASAGGELWCAVEKRREIELLFASARFSPDRALPAALLASAVVDAETAAIGVVRGHLDTRGPTTAAQLARATALDVDTVSSALARLETEGFALRGRFDPEEADEQYCARRLLTRIHAYTQERLRREIEPVSAQDFMRFLLRWQHVEPGRQADGPRGLLHVLSQLQGCELAAAAWESDVLPARVHGYRREWLDQLCLSGQVTWGRLSVPAPRAAGLNARVATPSRATPIAFGLRTDWPWLLRASRGVAPPQPVEIESGDTAEVLACLKERGASFAGELAAQLGMDQSRVLDALADGVARGRVTADGFGAMRLLLGPGKHRVGRGLYLRRDMRARVGGGAVGQGVDPLPRQNLRQGLRGAISSDGRWALLSGPSGEDSEIDPDALAEAVGEQLLARWGVVFRDLFLREDIALPWRDVLWALRRLEARGVIRGGRFVTGFVGEQYALPEAVEALRAVRRSPRDGAEIELSACDPLNLVGTLLPGARVPAVRTQSISLRDGSIVDKPDAFQPATRSAAAAIAVLGGRPSW